MMISKKVVLALFTVLVLNACSSVSERAGAVLYRMGHYDRALETWQRAAKAGDGGAAFRLGASLLDGVVVQQDAQEALRWLKLGAKLGDARAQYELGSLYDHGKGGVARSESRAAQYYLAAARKGLPEAQYNIATMYEKGEGLDQNLSEAYKFYTLAIENDFATFAEPARDRLSYQMSRAQIELAKLRAEAFREGKHTGFGGL